ncbi:hypothetical protein DBR43_20905 [Pedobacter sp. KBW06]|uniref:M56 family metallopeptidase n=1 Tax=Pedobacter sp. KBW06 TaxID=2153359 RepID=UPI000F5AC6F3|nr:M56 family metallopeptidase [Pedobacter sp. KBW06]RQO70476.1 hypothetical protein DBR43_20905 [Pedobacter sp. KBW06]
MPEFFVFLLKVNAGLLLFCLAYYLILRKLTFYTLNRFFLLAGIVFSSLYPFVDPMALFGQHEEALRPIAAVLPTFYIAATDAAGFDYWFIARVIFWAGVLIMSGRMLIRFYSLYRVHQSSVPGKVNAYEVRFLEGNISTFSFWRNIYLNPDLHQPTELDAVLEHEQVHVKEWHTVDILLAELTTVFYWFNPGVWYMRKAIKENVEFITDQQILKKGIDRKAYQYSMIHTVSSGTPSVLMNNFNITGIKRRIIMMNSRKSSGVQLIRYVFLLPVLLVLTTAFTLFKTEIKANLGFQPALKTNSRSSAAPKAEKSVLVTEKKIVKEKNKSSKIVPELQQTSKKAEMETAVNIAQTDTGKRLTTIQIRRIDAGETNADGAPVATRMAVFKTRGVGSMHLTSKDSVKVLVLKGNRSDTKPAQVTFIGEDPDIKIYIDDVEVSAEKMRELNPIDIESVNVQKTDQYPKTKGVRIYTKDFKKLK